MERLIWNQDRDSALVKFVRGADNPTTDDVLDHLKSHPVFKSGAGLLARGKIQSRMRKLRRQAQEAAESTSSEDRRAAYEALADDLVLARSAPARYTPDLDTLASL